MSLMRTRVHKNYKSYIFMPRVSDLVIVYRMCVRNIFLKVHVFYIRDIRFIVGIVFRRKFVTSFNLCNITIFLLVKINYYYGQYHNHYEAIIPKLHWDIISKEKICLPLRATLSAKLYGCLLKLLSHPWWILFLK